MNELTQINNSNFVMDSMLNPTTFEQMQRAATLFSKSGLVPANFQNNAAACFVGLQLAGAIGCNPFMLFQGLYSISGKIALETKLAVAIANRSGVFTAPITHTFKGEGKTRSCTASATLSKSGKEVSLTVDWDTVEKEGWNKRNGSKWNTMPDQMFRYRSSMWLIRTYAPEVLSGLSSVDEIQDSQIIDVTPRVKNIDEAFAEMAKPAEVITEQPAPKIHQTEKPVEAEKNLCWHWCENEKCSEPIQIDHNVYLNTQCCPKCGTSTLHEAKTNTKKAAADERLAFIKNQREKKAETVVKEANSKLNDLKELINKYEIKKAALIAYTVQAIGSIKSIEDLNNEEIEKLIKKINSVKGDNLWNSLAQVN